MIGSPEHKHEERTEGRAAAIQLSLLAAGIIVAALASFLTDTVATALIVFALIMMIMVHELGHYLVAKWSGMKVTEFFFGFGPRIWSFKKGETEYGIKAFPLGGYVRIIGMSNIEEVSAEDEPRTYREKPFKNRFGVAIAGSAMHMLMAFFTYLLLITAVGLPAASTSIGSIAGLKDGPSPAQDAGLQLGDKVLAINGNKVDDWVEDVPPYIREHAGQPLQFTIERNGQQQELTVTPVDRRLKPAQDDTTNRTGDKPYGFVGIGPAEYAKKTNFVSAIPTSAKQVGEGSVEVVKSLGKIFQPSGIKAYTETVVGTSTATKEEQAETRFMSPVGLVSIASDAANSGLRNALMLFFIINLFVGIFNMIPLLPFDGGHAAIAVYEKARSLSGARYRADHAKMMPVLYAVLAVYGLIVVSALYLDITQPLDNIFKQ